MTIRSSMSRRTTTKVMRGLIASGLSIAFLGATSPVVAEPANPSDTEIASADSQVGVAQGEVSKLVASVSNSDSEIAALELEMGGLREAVNKALVDLHDAQSSAERARQGVTVARKKLDDIQAEILKAQKTLDEISRSAYRQGAVPSGVAGVSGKATSEEALDRQTFLRTNAQKQREAVDALDRLRTEQANEESRLREVKNLAEKRESEAESAKASAQQAIDSSNSKLEENLRKRAELISKREEAQRGLDSARGNADSLRQQRSEYEEYKRAEEARKKAEAEAAAAEKARQEAEAARKAKEEAARIAAEAARKAADEAARKVAAEKAEKARQDAEKAAEAAQAQAEAERQASENRRSTANDSARAAAALIEAATPNHASLDDPYDSNNQDGNYIAAVENEDNDSSILDDLDVAQVDSMEDISEKASALVENASRSEKIEIVISRAMAYIGTPYAWGGGNASGPTQGIRDGGVADSFGDFNKIGFDCSGLTLYAFAGVGIALPHYTGYQYQKGTKVDPSNMQRGDLIFYGPNAEYHVAIYLGDGTMIEAPQSGSSVKVSPVRWSGMSPYAVRLI
ncbi:NlpC/P60 family protein [Corynebacterium diphtheriae bv. mitis]|uniref:Putative invasion protein n=1 Tax=Corynebacterium diphtheriae TaxID=1717 RepID=E0D6W4_CORDP|nr:NlpC/P60 family protein [Corynebacterium diphtheriae]AEX41968.1 cell wall-associated hydrolase resuscitation promoting factor interacting protein [Corynebacterium diphtheriae 31A]AEX44277.1 cell wall-associated hydrolase resuscitation promoting factor interacting protein [Corynebacterium diphtheriae 241]AEX48783.1 cell wall-associated hydrolase resuscitation promoting factor interacting protein [Corynebacterium diphtheriae BH8]AEX69915.1 cell wall-associated hydrolase resuscitation promoting